MCLLMVILRVITINYSHRTLIINFSLHFFNFVYGELLGGGDDCTDHPPHLKYWGGGDISPHPPGIDTHVHH